jgi:hypothetical protein
MIKGILQFHLDQSDMLTALLIDIPVARETDGWTDGQTSGQTISLEDPMDSISPQYSTHYCMSQIRIVIA